MKKLAEVEEAKAVMTAAVDWSVMKWLREKKKVRHASDVANNALWAMQKQIKTSWSEDLRAAYNELVQEGKSVAGAHKDAAIDPEVKALAKRVKEADDEADKAHEDAEDTFAKAEKILSTSMAREGCRKAILSWDLYEKAIVKAEAGVVSGSVK
jgi:seryl-tRNA synthetase